MNTSNYQLLLKKLDEFIRKFYVNQILRGVILFFGLAISLFLAIILIEYFGNFNSTIRTVLFYGFTLLLISVFVKLIALPGLKLISIGKRISHENASSIIGTHFSNVSDKLGNILQLKTQNENHSSDLIMASINQKIETLKPIPFSMAVNFKENRKYLKYLIVPATIIFGLAAFEPKIITDSSSRIIAHDQDFIPIASYQIQIENKNLNAFKNEDYNLKLSLNGEEIPNKLNVIFSGQRFLMIKEGKNTFRHTFKNIQKDIKFSFFDGEFESNSYELTVLPMPLLMDFSIELGYPKYLRKKDVVLQNTGDLIVPQGTQVRWVFETENTNNLTFIRNDSAIDLRRSAENEFTLSERIFHSGGYGLSAANQYLKNADTAFYSLDVIPDTRPSIELDTKVDSTNSKLRYFKGFVKDDYGFSRLVFYSQFIGGNDSLGEKVNLSIPINLSLPQTDFYHSLNTSQFNLKAGDEIEYYFEIWDNDGINGSKSARTQKFRYKAPTKNDVKQKNKENNELVQKELKESIELTKEIKKELEQLNEKLLNKKELGFQEKKQLKSLLDKQKKVQQSLEKLNKKNNENNKLQEEFTPEDKALLEKQKQLQELFEKVMTEEMKEMMMKMEEMMEKMKKDDLQKSLEKMELNNKELEKELDRNLELFKQLELEKQLADAKEKLDEIKEKQEKLEEKDGKAEDIKKEQDELNKDFEELSKEMDEIEKKNEELEEPNDLEKTENLEEEIKKDMKESSDELQKKNKKKAGEKQEDAGKKMDEMSKKMESMMASMQSEANAENLEDLRALLENLIQLSFDQEAVMENLKTTDKNDPRYVKLAQEQKKLKDDSKIIEDSLFALSKRIQQLSSTINKEMTAVNFNMEKALDDLGERRTPQAANRQQLSMTSLNNLALLLDAAVQQMQMQMQEQKGMGECKKPGQGKPKPGSMKGLQKQLNKQMEGLKKAMEEGKKPGDKPGKKPGEGKPGGMGGMSKELAQMAAKQAAIRQAVEQLQEKIGESNGSGSGSLKKLGELMEQTETDLVNKQITNQTLLRQQEILTRLLQSEKAEREREKDEKREATEFTDEISRNPNTFFEYNKIKEQEIELLITLPPSFNNYYKTKVSEYFNKIDK